MLSYAQIYEDVFLERCFSQKQAGFYIDIGACHPVHCNSSYHFYTRGWSGINVEPTPFRCAELARARPRDTNLMLAVGDRCGRANFNLSLNADHLSSLGSLPSELMDAHHATVETIVTDIVTLADLCKNHAHSPIDFLKIDVEGAEEAVILGGDWQKWRPSVVLVESINANDRTPTWGGWEPLLLQQGYAFAYFDGVNRYYVANERADLLVHFSTPINPFDGAVALHGFGHSLADSRHPDHAWAINYAKMLLNAASCESDEHMLQVMTWDLLASEKNASPSRKGIGLAFQRVLHRAPGEHDIRHWEGRPDLTLTMLFAELLRGEEFRLRRSRVSAYSINR